MSDAHTDPRIQPHSPLPQEISSELTRSILTRTSGSPCRRFRDLACDFVDGLLEQEWDHLARTHLENCSDCRSLVHALQASASILPAFVELNPGPWFSQRVLHATAQKSGLVGCKGRRLWWETFHRPRIALEAAYMSAAVVMLGISLPIPSLNALVSPPGMAALKAPVHRTINPVIQAGRRTAAIPQRTLLPSRRAGSFRRIGSKISLRIYAWPGRDRRLDPSPLTPNQEPRPIANR